MTTLTLKEAKGKRAEQRIRGLNAELEQRVRDRTAQLQAANEEKDALLLRERDARAEAEALLIATASLGVKADLQEVLKTLVQQAATLLDASAAAYAIEQGGRLFVQGRWQQGAWTAVRYEVLLEASIFGHVWRSGRLYRTNRLASDPYADRRLAAELEQESMVAAPLLGPDGERLGLIAAFNSRQPNGFSERDERLLVAFCAQASLVLDRARAMAARQVAEQEAIRSKEEVESLLVAAERLNGAVEPEEVLLRVVEVAVEFVSATRVSIVMNEGDHALIRHSWYDGVWELHGARLSIDGSLSGWVIQHEQSYRSADLQAEFRFHLAHIQQPLHSVLAVPVAARDGRVMAVLALFNQREGRPFSEEDQRLAEGIAHHAAVALERAGLTAELRRLNEELDQRVIARTTELEAANKELEAFSYSVSHDLRAPLRALDGFSRILLEDHAANLPEDAQRHLQIVRQSAQQMGQLVDDLLAFSRLGRQPLSKRPVAVAPLIREVLTSLHDEQQGRCLEVSIDDLPVCQADPALLRQVFMNLLSNALKFTHQRDMARIEIGCLPETEDAGKIVYFVRDNGAGFDMQYAAKLFGVFQRLHRAEDYEGTGVGLAIVQRIIHRHGGRVWAEAEVNNGATFYISLERTHGHA